MNLSELPTYRPDIAQLKNQLRELCGRYGITKFEPDDMVELLGDGEDVSWIVNQLRGEKHDFDIEMLTKLLTEIQQAVASPEDETTEEEKAVDSPVEGAEIFPDAMPDLSQLDLSQVDFSQLGDIPLLPGMTLPPGMNTAQLKKILSSPQGKFLADFSLFCQEKGVDLMGGFLSDPAQQEELNQEWLLTPRPALGGKTPKEMLEEDPLLMPQRVETYRREEPRIGRNDPCSCGSGKKFKKCCGAKK